MTPEQWKAIQECIDENVILEEQLGLKPRFKELKQDLAAILNHGNPTTIEELDWYTIDALVTEKWEALRKDYAVAQIRKRGL